jgi:hypothetical protein
MALLEHVTLYNSENHKDIGQKTMEDLMERSGKTLPTQRTNPRLLRSFAIYTLQVNHQLYIPSFASTSDVLSFPYSPHSMSALNSHQPSRLTPHVQFARLQVALVLARSAVARSRARRPRLPVVLLEAPSLLQCLLVVLDDDDDDARPTGAHHTYSRLRSPGRHQTRYRHNEVYCEHSVCRLQSLTSDHC